MRSKRMVATAVAVLACLVALGACSSDERSSDDTDPSGTVEPFIPEGVLTPDEYTERMSELCDELVRGEGVGGDLEDPEEIEAELERLTLAYEEVRQILTPPEQEVAVQAWFDQADLVLVKLEELAQARADGDDDLAEQTRQELDDAAAELETLGEDVGLSGCAEVNG
jgi:hypothetical protein